MLGYYENRNLTENERKILNSEPDDYTWHVVVLMKMFGDSRSFQMRDDIELPDNGEGRLLIFEKGDIVYFKTLYREFNKKEVDKIYDVCVFLEDLFKSEITSYLVCQPQEIDFDMELDYEKDYDIVIGQLPKDNKENVIDRLKYKLENNIPFTINDSIAHIILPFTTWKDEEFDKNYAEYMKLIEAYDGDWNNT